MHLTEADPKGLIRESYVIDGITAGNAGRSFWIGHSACQLPPIFPQQQVL